MRVWETLSRQSQACECGGQRWTLGLFISPPAFLRQLSSENQSIFLPWQWDYRHELAVNSTSNYPHQIRYEFDVDARNLNSDPWAFRASTVLTWPSPQPQMSPKKEYPPCQCASRSILVEWSLKSPPNSKSLPIILGFIF